jgi:hypothetical protein
MELGWGDFDPRSVGFEISVPRSMHLELLSQLVLPVLHQMKTRKMVSGWSYSLAEKIEIFITPTLPLTEQSAVSSAAAVQAALGTPLARVGLSLVPMQGPGGASKEEALFRYGGTLGLNAITLFGRRDSRLCAELIELGRANNLSDRQRLELRFADYFFLFDVLGLDRSELGKAIEAWIELFSVKMRQEQLERFSALQSEAKVETENNQELRNILKSFSENPESWRQTSSEIRAIFSRHQRGMSRIGRMLSLNEGHFSAGRPRSLVILQSFCHFHAFRLRKAGSTELREYLIMREFSGGRRSGD